MFILLFPKMLRLKTQYADEPSADQKLQQLSDDLLAALESGQ